MADKLYEQIEELPELEGWSTVPQVALRMDVSRQRVNQWVQESKFPTVHRISEIIIIPEADIDAFEESRAGNTPRSQNKLFGD